MNNGSLQGLTTKNSKDGDSGSRLDGLNYLTEIYLADYDYIISRKTQTPRVPGAQVVDYGCRSNYWTTQYRTQNATANVFGIDTYWVISLQHPGPWHHHRKCLPVSSLDGSIPFPDGTQDLVRGARLDGRLHPREWIHFIEEAWRVLKWDGYLEIVDISRNFGGSDMVSEKTTSLFYKEGTWGIASDPSFTKFLKAVGSKGNGHFEVTIIEQDLRAE